MDRSETFELKVNAALDEARAAIDKERSRGGGNRVDIVSRVCEYAVNDYDLVGRLVAIYADYDDREASELAKEIAELTSSLLDDFARGELKQEQRLKQVLSEIPGLVELSRIERSVKLARSEKEERTVSNVDDVIERLEKDYFLIKRRDWYYWVGGAIVTAVAIVGISWAGLKSAVAKRAEAEIVTARDRVKTELVPQFERALAALEVDVEDGRLRLGDMQICWGRTGAIGSGQREERYGKTFKETPEVFMSGHGAIGSGSVVPRVTTVGNDVFKWAVSPVAGDVDYTTFSWIALGKWR